MTGGELTADMIWYECLECDRNFTLADLEGVRCPHCGSISWVPYESDD